MKRQKVHPMIAPAVLAISFFLLTLRPCRAVELTAGDLNSWFANVVISGIDVAPNGGEAVSGQTFRINDGNALVDNFVFPIYSYSATTSFQLGVAAWNGTQPAGSLLYLSAIQVATSGWQMMTVSPSNLRLNAGQEYVFFLTCDAFSHDGVNLSADLGYVPTAYYTDGEGVSLAGFQLSNNDLFTQAWGSKGGNMAFAINYQIPEKSNSLLLLGLSGLALGFMKWILRRQEI